jgi:hypothetical protein
MMVQADFFGVGLTWRHLAVKVMVAIGALKLPNLRRRLNGQVAIGGGGRAIWGVRIVAKPAGQTATEEDPAFRGRST